MGGDSEVNCTVHCIPHGISVRGVQWKRRVSDGLLLGAVLRIYHYTLYFTSAASVANAAAGRL